MQMPIGTRTWLGRLTSECPGWYFWYSPAPFPDRPWHGAPHTAGGRPDGDPMRLPGRIDTADPKVLRDTCRDRGDDDCPVCETCGQRMPAGGRR